MSALRVINETTATNVSTLTIDNIFSDKFKFYKVQLTVTDGTANDNVDVTLINSFGGLNTDSVYWAGYDMNSSTSFTDVKFNGTTNRFRNLTQVDSNSGNQGACVLYFFDPFESSDTYLIGQSAQTFGSTNAFRSRRYFANSLGNTSCTGLHFSLNNSGAPDWDFKCFGISGI